MMRPLRIDLVRSLCAALGLALLALATPAATEPPAAIPSASEDRARESFAEFAEDWMEKVQLTTEEARRNPTIRPGAANPMVTFRGYADDYTVELRPTGHASAPYVGILRYKEELYSCADVRAVECSVTSTIPVTEIFRFQAGRWVY